MNSDKSGMMTPTYRMNVSDLIAVKTGIYLNKYIHNNSTIMKLNVLYIIVL